MELGRPIGHTVPTSGFDQGEHGAGTGLSGGHGHVGTHNTQAGMAHAEQSGSGSTGIPTGTPIADKFTSQGQGQNSVAGAYAGGATDDGLTGQSNAHRTGAGVGPLAENLPTSHASAATGAHHGHHGHQGTSGVGVTGAGQDAVSGAYEGGPVRGDALTGESHAHRTGAGVGPLGENLPAGSTAGQHGHGARDAALATTAGGALAGAGAVGAAQHGRGSDVGTGVGPAGGAGGHYSSGSTGTNQLTDNYGLGSGQTSSAVGTTGTGNDSGVATGGLGSGTGASGAGVLDAQRAGAQAHREGHSIGAGALGAGAGAAGLGAGAGAAGVSHDGQGQGGVNKSAPSANNERGQPIMDPKELDHGGRHGLILDPATGKYVHRHEVEETGKKI